ncbi:hypothetical protein SCHPADRAFT_712648 [Schizopora paradoxa]|uniref:Uncharacterized protein n=1 Tax=Schizopora paradoxa TaxID=27342 RepID=A0A0H2RLR5_9AGAM|nr:hypothetical protein SCHPADRAFT_712648 [Schizopora paradoxa]
MQMQMQVAMQPINPGAPMTPAAAPSDAARADPSCVAPSIATGCFRLFLSSPAPAGYSASPAASVTFANVNNIGMRGNGATTMTKPSSNAFIAHCASIARQSAMGGSGSAIDLVDLAGLGAMGAGIGAIGEKRMNFGEITSPIQPQPANVIQHQTASTAPTHLPSPPALPVRPPLGSARRSKSTSSSVARNAQPTHLTHFSHRSHLSRPDSQASSSYKCMANVGTSTPPPTHRAGNLLPVGRRTRIVGYRTRAWRAPSAD